ncbi:hypothetical protein ABZ318_32150 [Streptomyces sp. NPDC006197]|uniref:hypothetical protein n=1 Tax=Streptomyces sp. NPDC006197 TaxID=3156685 RepID=UPI0033BBD5DE
MNRLDAIAYRLARTIARRRGSRPALHPRGMVLTGRLTVPGRPPPWGVPWRLDRPGSYRVTARWSRAAGLPYPLPDGLGLTLRVEDTEGPGRPLELLPTTSGRSDVALLQQRIGLTRPKDVRASRVSTPHRVGRLRHPRYMGLRDDKRPIDVIRERGTP